MSTITKIYSQHQYKIENGTEKEYGNLNIGRSVFSRLNFKRSTDFGSKQIKIEEIVLKFYCYRNVNKKIEISVADANSLKRISNNFTYYTPTIGNNTVIINNQSILSEIESKININQEFSIMLTPGEDNVDIGIYPYQRGSESSEISLQVKWGLGVSEGRLSKSIVPIDESQTLTIYPSSPNFSHKVKWIVNGTIVQGLTTVNGNQNSFKFLKEHLKNFPQNSNSALGKVILYTYDGDAELGNIEYNFTIVDNSGPAIKITLQPQYISGVNKEKINNKYVTNITQIKWLIELTPSGNSTLKNCKISFSGGIQQEFNPIIIDNTLSYSDITSIIINNSNITCTVTATDSRNLSSTISQEITSIITYNKPSLKISSIYRCASKSPYDKDLMNGKSIKAQGVWSFSQQLPNGEPNKLEPLTANFKQGTDINLTYNIDTNFNLIFGSDNGGIFNNSIITVTFFATDLLGVSNIYTYTIPAANYILHFPQGGLGIGIGTYYSKSDESKTGYIDCGWALNMQKGFKIGELDFTSIPSFNANIETGTTKVQEQQKAFVTKLGGPFLKISGGTLTGGLTIAKDGITINSGGINLNDSIKINSQIKGLYLTDKTNQSYAGIYDAGAMLWIGANAVKGIHHVGTTIISSGWNSNQTKGNSSILICEPSKDSSTHSYIVLHSGNYTNYISQFPGTISINTPCYGYLTSGRKQYTLIVPIGKSLEKISTATIISMIGWARGNNTYLINSTHTEAGSDFKAISTEASLSGTLDKITNCIIFYLEHNSDVFTSDTQNNNSVYIFQPKKGYFQIKLE